MLFKRVQIIGAGVVSSQAALGQPRGYWGDGPLAHGNIDDGIQPNGVSATATIGVLGPYPLFDPGEDPLPMPRPGPGGGDGVIPPISAPDLLALDALSLMTLPDAERLRLAPLPTDARDVFIDDLIDFGDVSLNGPTGPAGGAPIPEPTTAALLVLTMLAMLRRRRAQSPYSSSSV